MFAEQLNTESFNGLNAWLQNLGKRQYISFAAKSRESTIVPDEVSNDWKVASSY